MPEVSPFGTGPVIWTVAVSLGAQSVTRMAVQLSMSRKPPWLALNAVTAAGVEVPELRNEHPLNCAKRSMPPTSFASTKIGDVAVAYIGKRQLRNRLRVDATAEAFLRRRTLAFAADRDAVFQADGAALEGVLRAAVEQEAVASRRGRRPWSRPMPPNWTFQ